MLPDCRVETRLRQFFVITFTQEAKLDQFTDKEGRGEALGTTTQLISLSDIVQGLLARYKMTNGQ